MYEDLALLTIFILVYSSVAGFVERSWISGPIVFTCFGLSIGAEGFDLLSWNADKETMRNLAEITLAIVLFTDAAGANMRVLEKTSMLPVRLLFIGLPLTLLLGFGLGVMIFDGVSLLIIALLATMLAPTDAALGQAVVTNQSVPDDVRQALNAESGLNDGICVPVLFLFLAMALDHAGDGNTAALAVKLFIEEIGIGLAVGLSITFISVQILKISWQKKWLTPTWIQIPVIALALTCFSLAQYLGGSGFIAAFSGGLLFAVLEKNMRDKFLSAAEGTGDIMALITWVIFGSAVAGSVLQSISWQVLLYAILSLTVIRMLPVFLALSGSGISTEGKLFIGWFGPRGLASIVFAVIVLSSNLPVDNVLTSTVACTIILSIILHGTTANSWARAFGKRSEHAK